MGTIFSSNKDFNRVLAKQPRTSINIPKFEPPNNLHERTSTDPFLIPARVPNSQIEGQEQNTTSILPNESVELAQTFKQSNPSSAVEKTNLSTVINNQEQQKSKEEQPEQQINAQNSSYSIRSNSPTHHETITSDPVVISRSFIDINDQQQKKNHFSSSFRPFNTIVERNGEQFLVEFKQRTERRYVQYIDETTHQKRVFEVTDCIPYRTIRPYRDKSQYLSQNDIVRPPILDDHPKSVAPANPIDNGSLNNLVNNASEHDLQHNNINEPFTNKTPQNAEYVSSTALFAPQSASISRLTTKDVADSINQHSQYSQPSSFQSLSTDPKNTLDQYSSEQFHKQPPLFRVHTPIISDDSASSYTSNSSEEETDTDDDDIIAQILRSNESLSRYEQMNSYFFDNRNSTAVSYQTDDIYNSSTQLNPFARSLNPSDRHHYEKQPTIQNYVEPVMNNPRFQQSASPDYSPISIPIKQPNQNQYSRSNDSQKKCL